jgi:hypothetical protein
VDRQEPDNAKGAHGDCVGRLAARRDEVRRALGGHALHVLLDDRDRGTTIGVLLTSGGHVVRVPVDELEPHVEVRGTPEQIRAFLVGDLALYDAVVERVVLLRVETDEIEKYRALRDLVADTLR